MSAHPSVGLHDNSSSMARALGPVAGSGHQLSFLQPKLAGCSQRLGANTKQRSFHFQWAITQQHLGERPLRDYPIFFFYIKQWWLHQPPRPNGIKTWRAFLFVLLIPSQKQEFSPLPPFFLFANDVEIGNHFVFSVIMNIWCMPSAHVVVWWAWPWLLVQKKKETYKCTSWFRLSYFWQD